MLVLPACCESIPRKKLCPGSNGWVKQNPDSGQSLRFVVEWACTDIFDSSVRLCVFGSLLPSLSIPNCQVGLSKVILGFAGIQALGFLCATSRAIGSEASNAKKAVDCLAAP